MSTVTSRLLFFACMTCSLVFFSGCGPKEIEPYQQKAGGNKPEATQDSSFYDYGSATTEDAVPIADSTPLVETAPVVEPEENIDSFLDSLPGREEEIQDAGLMITGPAVEPLDSGSGLGETLHTFGQKQSTAYKKRNGRSSPQLKSVYYDFDQSIIRDNQIPKMEANAQYLKNNTGQKVAVEGNCDERGTNEYNLALGERRAMNTKKYLIKLGVRSSRLRTVSYGEERPLFLGSEEDDYAENRRVDFVLE